MAFALRKPTRRPSPTQPAQAANDVDIFPAAVRGLSIETSLLDQDPKTAQILKNFWCRRYGNEVRKGYQRWLTNIGAEVVSIMPYNPPRASGGAFLPKLFAAATNGNIYDATSRHNEVFVPPVAQAIPGAIQPGLFSYTQFSVAGANYLIACAAGVGVWSYDHVGGWVNRTAAITGTAGANLNFDFVVAWKSRLWFIEYNSTKAWFLPVNVIGGAATLYDFGPLLAHGGQLEAMASWTVDGGNGLDDKLVLVGQGGDVLIYGGTDPTVAANFGLIGKWFVGRVPTGRRILGQYGGDLTILCEHGLEKMSLLTTGRGLIAPKQETTPGYQYMEALARDIKATYGQNFWQMFILSGEQSVVVITPHKSSTDAKQYAYAVLADAWSEHYNMPMACADILDGDMYFGTLDGKVCKAFNGDSDDELFDGTAGASIIAEVQTAFVPPKGDRSHLKSMIQVMPMFQAPATPQVKCQVNTEWSLQSVPGSPVFNPDTVAKWNIAKWNQAVWAGGQNTYFVWVGAEGLGVYASLRMSLAASPGTIFTSWKLMFIPGGFQ